jgi:putative heme-binding domain-containing protein
MKHLLRAALLSALPTLTTLAETAPPAGDKPKPAPTAPPPETVIKNTTLAPGLQMDTWASEPMLFNPVALAFDDRGRAFVAESFRRKSSVPDIRSYSSGERNWIPSTLALTSVADRVAFLKKTFPPNAGMKPTGKEIDHNKDGAFDWRDLEVEKDRVSVLSDSTGKGRADSVSIAHSGFNTLADMIAAGVTVADDGIRVICAPKIWHIDNQGTATPIVDGLGVHIVFSGHDAHGLKTGPDGRLYFSVGDCGANIPTKEGGRIELLSTGGVLRCWPDGSNLELVAKGLRNPDSLAFNELGDLFTGDNNADGGDKSRWIHVVPEADYGWRFHYQFVREPKLGVWNTEGLWTPDAGKKAPAVLPPVVLIGHGPSGVAYYPGTGLPQQYDRHFFMCDFPGGVRAFRINPSGASYAPELPQQVLLDNSTKEMNGKIAWGGMYISDVAFAPNGGLYMTEWGHGFEKTSSGRIFRIHAPEVDQSELVRETVSILGSDFKTLDAPRLTTLLAHADQRVRQKAQFAIAKREDALAILAPVLKTTSEKPFARYHATWALGQIGRTNPESVRPLLLDLLNHPEAETKTQALRTLADLKTKNISREIAPLLASSEARVAFHAALALRHSPDADLVPTLLEIIRQSSTDDAHLRHARVVALAACAPSKVLSVLTLQESSAVRLAAVLALRRQAAPEIAAFLNDSDAAVRTEAARAIYDLPIDSALPKLAALASRSDLPKPVLQRAAAAHHHLGTQKNADALIGIAADTQLQDSTRIEALVALRSWKPEDGRDLFLGKWWPTKGKRDDGPVRNALEARIPTLLSDPQLAVRQAAVETAAAMKSPSLPSLIESIFSKETEVGAVKAIALRQVPSALSSRLPDLLTAALAAKEPELRSEACRLLTKLKATQAISLMSSILASGDVRQRQICFANLLQMKSKEADELLETQMESLVDGSLPSGASLDLLEAASKRGTPALKELLKKYDKMRKAGDDLAKFRECLEGGDSASGRNIFREKDEAGCFRCHKHSGTGGDVGPALDELGQQHDREYILRAILYPNATFAKGYENVAVTLEDNSLVAGVVLTETATTLTLTPLGSQTTKDIPVTQIKRRDRIPSSMPEHLDNILSKRELRDLVEFLATKPAPPKN